MQGVDEEKSADAGLRVGGRYSRQHVQDLLGVPQGKRGGDWLTGYTSWAGEFYIFTSVGVPGRTGHDYQNRWDGDVLHWESKTKAKRSHPQIQRLLDPITSVHIFTRAEDRAPFNYEGRGIALKWEGDQPVTVWWKLLDRADVPEELPPRMRLKEGAVQRIEVNAYERNPAARRECLAHHGYACAVCTFDFAKRYGEIGEGYAHVHHLRPVSEIGEEYEIDPIHDLRPVCPNCHAMLHRARPPLSIEELRERLQ